MQLLQPPKQTKRVLVRDIKIVFKAAFAVMFFILGFNFSNSLFFREFPLFGIRYVAEVFISTASALFGFIVFPRLLVSLKYWIESTIAKTVKDVVYDF